MNDGGPAFPFTPTDFGEPGMSLRDWFAGMALANECTMGQPNVVAYQAYDFADAMLEHRAKTGETQ